MNMKNLVLGTLWTNCPMSIGTKILLLHLAVFLDRKIKSSFPLHSPFNPTQSNSERKELTHVILTEWHEILDS